MQQVLQAGSEGIHACMHALHSPTAACTATASNKAQWGRQALDMHTLVKGACKTHACTPIIHHSANSPCSPAHRPQANCAKACCLHPQPPRNLLQPLVPQLGREQAHLEPPATHTSRWNESSCRAQHSLGATAAPKCAEPTHTSHPLSTITRKQSCLPVCLLKQQTHSAPQPCNVHARSVLS
jgi:hypothetical protein